MIHPRGAAICRALEASGIRSLAWLPDSETVFMHDALRNSGLAVTQVCREGEALAFCAGVSLSGELGALLIENQGLFDAGNVLKWARNTRIPMLMLVSLLFSSSMEETADGTVANGQPEYTARFLDAFDIPFSTISTDESVGNVALAAETARSERRPVAVLLTSADGFQAGM